MNAKRAGIYARVSGEGQRDNTSLDNQIEKCRAYCQAKGYQIVAEKKEVISGVFVLARSKFSEYLEMGINGLLDVIVVDIPDRLGRGKAIAQLEFWAQLNNLSVEYATPGHDEATLEGRTRKRVDDIVSDQERDNIRRRTKEGRERILRSGRLLLSAYRTFGYRIERTFASQTGKLVSTSLVPIDKEVNTLKQIFTWCAVDGWSIHKIAKKLTDDEVPTVHGKKRQDGKEQWYGSTILRILRNQTYVGRWYSGKREVKPIDTPDGIKYKTRVRDSEEWIKVSVPPVIDTELFDAVQAELRKRKGRGFRPSKYPFLLRAKIHCARCNSLLGVASRTQRGKLYRYYRCQKTTGQYIAGKCQATQLRADVAEELVWAMLKERMQDQEALFAGIKTGRAKAERATKMLQSRIVALEVQNQKAQAKIDRWLDLYGEGGMSKEEFTTKKKLELEGIEKNNQEIEDLKKKLAEHIILSPEQEDELRTVCHRIALGIDNATEEDKSKYLEWLKVSCVYDDRTGELAVAGLVGNHLLHVTAGKLSDIKTRLKHNHSGYEPSSTARLPRRDARTPARGKVRGCACARSARPPLLSQAS